MKYSISLLSAAALVLASPVPAARDVPSGVLSIPFERALVAATANSGSKRRRGTNGTIDVPAEHGGYKYFSTVEIGTPSQSVRLRLDTGSSDLWVYGKDVQGRGGYFNQSASSTYELREPGGFNINYLSGSISGDTAKDTVAVGGASLPQFDIAVVNQASWSGEGILGVGPPDAERNIWSKNLPWRLKTDGYIQRSAFSLYLNSTTSAGGDILFGGIDTAKYEDKLYTWSYTDSQHFVIQFDFFGVTQLAGLDTGTSDFYVTDTSFHRALTEVKKAVPTLQGDGYYNNWVNSLAEVPSNASLPITILDHDYQIPLTPLFQQDGDVYKLRIQPSGDEKTNDLILGDAFLRAFYVVHDIDGKQIALALAKDTTESNIVPIPESGIPDDLVIDP